MEILDFAAAYLPRLRSLPAPAPTGVTADTYRDIIAHCLCEYDKFHNIASLHVETVADNIQAFSRIVSSMAVLFAAGSIDRYRDRYPCGLFRDDAAFRALFVTMMTEACEQSTGKYSKPNTNSFAVKEIMLAYHLTHHLVGEDQASCWKAQLSTLPGGALPIGTSTHNINIYAAAGEQIRMHYDICDAAEYIETSMQKQMSHFNRQGMYLDNYGTNHNPTLYDLTTRVQLSLLPLFGYEGAYRAEVDEILEKGAFVTLFAQSALGQLAYAGRSNGYLFNEMLISSDCEYAAAMYKKKGDLFLAGVYKRAAHLAIDSVRRFLESGKHIRNFYSDHKIGTDPYGHYDKYMVTMASFLAIGCLWETESQSDDVPEQFCPSEIGGYVWEESEEFNNIIASSGKTSVQIHTRASEAYDSTGFARIHRVGLSAEMIASMPCCRSPHYRLPDGFEPKNASISAVLTFADGETVKLCDCMELYHTLKVEEAAAGKVVFTLEYSGDALRCATVRERYTVCDDSVTVEMSCTGAVSLACMLPVIMRNGDMPGKASTSEATLIDSGMDVRFGGYEWQLKTDGNVRDTGEAAANRIGEYRLYEVEGTGCTVTLRFEF